MAHSHDHTLLARLGFADPDRREPWHDVACQYLTQPDIMAKVAAMLPHRKVGGSVSYKSEVGQIEGTVSSADVAVTGALEVQVFKGFGQYRTTVGFIDVALDIEFRWRVVGRLKPPPVKRHGRYEGGSTDARAWIPETEIEQDWQPHEADNSARKAIGIEVKAHPATAGDVLRQISVYREHWHADTWLLATCYPITAREAEALTQAKILHVQLDPARIATWAEQRDAEAYVAPTL